MYRYTFKSIYKYCFFFFSWFKMKALCRDFRDKYNIAAITNDIFTQEDGEFLMRHKALPEERIKAIETGKFSLYDRERK